MENQTKTTTLPVNLVELNGHLGGDPQLVDMKSDYKKVRVSMAQNVYTQSGRTTQWFTLIAWGELAEKMVEQLRKGDMILCKGRILIRDYKDKEGQTRTATEIVLNSFSLYAAELQKAG
ncbi:MAG: single-stranded DNA-binding protein [Bacteroidia bacterium]|jgi:single-strand DNA-binding protein|nr:single-stranded DNA-binding protein [Bacteroidia bacterium]